MGGGDGNPSLVRGVSGNKGGRPKGTGRAISNAITLLQDLKFDSIEELIKLYRGDETNIDEKIRILGILSKKQYPDLRTVEVSGNLQGSYALNILFSKPD